MLQLTIIHRLLCGVSSKALIKHQYPLHFNQLERETDVVIGKVVLHGRVRCVVSFQQGAVSPLPSDRLTHLKEFPSILFVGLL